MLREAAEEVSDVGPSVHRRLPDSNRRPGPRLLLRGTRDRLKLRSRLLGSKYGAIVIVLTSFGYFGICWLVLDCIEADFCKYSVRTCKY